MLVSVLMLVRWLVSEVEFEFELELKHHEPTSSVYLLSKHLLNDPQDDENESSRSMIMLFEQPCLLIPSLRCNYVPL